MKSILKWLGYGVGALVAIIVIAGVAFALLFDANDLRDDLTNLVKKETGRDLVINGDLELSFFPWLGFTIGDATMSNAAGFGDEPFATFGTASARARLIPLLSRRLEVGKLGVEGLTLNLMVAADGSTNWDDLAGLADDSAGEDTAGAGSSLASQSIGGVEMTNLSLRYRDAGSKSDYQLSGGRLATGELRPGQPFSLEIGADIETTIDSGRIAGDFSIGGRLGKHAETGQWRWHEPAGRAELGGDALPVSKLDLKMAATMVSVDEGRVQVAYPKLEFDGSGPADAISSLKGTLRSDSLWLSPDNEVTAPQPSLEFVALGGGMPGERMDMSVTGREVTGSLDSEIFTLKELVGTAMGLSFTGDATVERAFTDPQARGSVTVARFSPRELMGRMAIKPPHTADPAALSRAGLNANYVVSENALGFSRLRFNLDDTSISGEASILDFDAMGIRFELFADTIDLDRYLAPTVEGGQGASVAGDVEVPTQELRDLNLEGTLKIGKMQLAGIRSTNVEIAVKAADGAVRVFPSKAELYGGTYNGDVRLDVRGEKPVLSMNETLTNVKFGALSQDLLQASDLSGTLSGTIRLTGTGENIADIRRTLNGDGNFRFVDGAYERFNLWYEIRKAVALVKREPAPQVPAENRTVFSNMSGTATVTNGIVQNDDLAMLLPFIRVNGNGQLNLVEQTVDYKVKAEVIEGDALDQVSAANDLVGYEIPVRVSGPISDLKVRPEVGPILAQIAKRELGGKIGDKLNDKLGEALGGVLGSKLGLGGSSNKAPAPVQEPAPAVAADSAADAAGTTQNATTATAAEAPAPAEKPQSLEDQVKSKLFKKLLGGSSDKEAPAESEGDKQ